MRILLATFLFVSTAHAQMDANSRDLLIEKLQRVQIGLATKDPSKVSVTLRLADLYAERARSESMKEIEQGCEACGKSARNDRTRAAKLYQEVFDLVPVGQKSSVLIQLGHIFQMQGEDAKALQFYSRIDGNADPVMRAEAQLSIAEVYFRQRAYQKAEPYYKEVLKTEGAASKGLAAYRLAWCSFNLGQTESAKDQLLVMLKTPNLLNRQGTSTGQADRQFHEEVSIDLATFIARNKVTEADLKALYSLSPENIKLQNIVSVANEAGRIGKKQEALTAWLFVEGQLSDPSARLSAWTNLAGLQMDLGQKDKALTYYQKALALRSEIKTCNDVCKEADQRLRQILVTWNQLEKTAPSEGLAAAYRAYEEQYKEDGEVHYWSARVHRDRKDWDNAWNASTAAVGAFAKDNTKGHLESVLLSRLEIAELAKNEAWLLEAQNNYLALGKSIERLQEVQYQKAQKTYDKGNYAEAAPLLRELALNKKMDAKLRKQAADLALDALVLLKDEDRIATWSKEFVTNFSPKEAQDFVKIEQKSLLTQSAKVSAERPADAYALLLGFKPNEASLEDKITYYKNKVILAEKLNKFNEGSVAADDLLNIPQITAEDREFALAKKARFAELALDFPSSLKALEKMKMSSVSSDQRLLKLALYSQLAGQNPDGYFREYLKTAKTEGQINVALELVRSSKEPMKELERQQQILAKNPELLGQAYLDVYLKEKNNPAVARKALANKVVKDTSAGKIFARMEFLEEYKALKAKVEKHQMQSTTQKALTASIKSRAALLEQVEKLANKAIQTGDWTSQLVSIQLVAAQSERFYSELLSLPMPQGLSPEEEGEYLNILGQQAAPYQSKAQQAKTKVDEFWAQGAWKEAYQKSWEKEESRGLVKSEISVLKEIAPSTLAPEWAKFEDASTVASPRAPSLQVVELSRSKVRREPFNVGALKELLELEKQSRNRPMVQYLEGRIETTNGGTVQ